MQIQYKHLCVFNDCFWSSLIIFNPNNELKITENTGVLKTLIQQKITMLNDSTFNGFCVITSILISKYFSLTPKQNDWINW